MQTTPRGFVPGPKPCPHCGRVLQPLTADLNGREVFAGWEPCGCDGAAAARAEWEAERRRADEAASAASWERKLDASGIPPRFRDARHPWARRLAERIAAGDGLYLHGGNGTGKTTLACAAALICLRNGMSVRFAVATKLLDELREFGEAQRELLAALARCDLLVVDDLGKEGAATPRAAEKLFDLFNDRYNSQTLVHPRPFVVTSNFPRNEVAVRVSDGGSGVAIASRLRETTEAVLMGGEDWRIHGKN
ncbi:ATP-binding protein [Adlercreutzia caecimuris]|uniref:ATP-binding protein n=1 Tax=Adlercreutzia caecimuris TaxID=671266 RepID=UPI0013649282|nr:ATP-binding protein [Adlercreutzia caecimuris]NBJ66131.1 ATP-binding protein [Adlercreutzia caecimuris]